MRRAYFAPAGDLPDGAIFRADDLISGREFWLDRGDRANRWTPGGYESYRPRDDFGVVTVLTPRSSVAALRAGYGPHYHPTAVG